MLQFQYHLIVFLVLLASVPTEHCHQHDEDGGTDDHHGRYHWDQDVQQLQVGGQSQRTHVSSEGPHDDGDCEASVHRQLTGIVHSTCQHLWGVRVV